MFPFVIIHTTISWKLIPRLAPGSSPPIGAGRTISPPGSQSQAALNHSALMVLSHWTRARPGCARSHWPTRVVDTLCSVEWSQGRAGGASAELAAALCLIKIRASPHFEGPAIYIYKYNENSFLPALSEASERAREGYLVNLICKYIPALCMF